MNMIKRNVSIGFAILLAVMGIGIGGCSSSNTTNTAIDESTIPENAYAILLYTSQSPEDYLGYIRRQSEGAGFNVRDFSIVRKEIYANRGGLEIRVLTKYDLVADKTVATITGSGSSLQESDDSRSRWFKAILEFCQTLEYDDLVFLEES